jgi:ABC-type Fe3+-siderophore transport system permease subunit
MTGVQTLGPIVVAGLVLALGLSRALDLHALGDDASSLLGQRSGRTQVLGVLVAVLLAAAAVTLTGPIGFVGLAAPAVARLLAARVPGLHRHVVLLPTAAVLGIVVVLGADVLLRLAFGSIAGPRVPTGVVTTMVGAAFLVALAVRARGGTASAASGVAGSRVPSRTTRILTFVVVSLLLLAVAVGGLLLGDAKLLAGDLVNWLAGRAGPVVRFVLDTRAPRVLAAALAGAALATAGAVVQAVTRNPLAEPAILGVTGGAGVGAVLLLTTWPFASFAAITLGGLAGAAVAAGLVFGLAARSGLASTRLILVGLGLSAASSALVGLLLVVTDPYNSVKALTWLSGSTYGRTLPQLVPVAVVLALLLPALWLARRRLDLLALDDDRPRLLGLRLGTNRWWLLAAAVSLTAAATTAVGVVGFVGLVAPHAARMMVGARHGSVLPLAAMLGAVLTCLADLVGRTIIAPGQLPAGLLTAAVGAPYFVWLLWRSRRLA